MSISSILTAALSLITPPSSDESNNVTVNISNNVAHTLEQQHLNPPQAKSQGFYVSDHKTLLITATATTYIGAYLYFNKLKVALNRPDSWSLWCLGQSQQFTTKGKEFFDKFKLFSLDKLAGKTEQSSHYSLNFFMITEINKEKELLQRYKSFASALSYLKLDSIFNIDTILLAQISHRLTHLNALEKLIYENSYTSWQADSAETSLTNSGQRETALETTW